MMALRRLHSPLRLLSRRALVAPAAEEVDYKSARVDKAALMKLRKRTGYSFVNCKKALVHHPDDLEAAEKWLVKLAAAEGWERAAKVGERPAAEGLIGLATSGPLGALVEVNCETEFVARSEAFQALVSAAAFSAIRLAASQPDIGGPGLPTRLLVSGEELASVEVPELQIPEIAAGQPLADLLRATLARLGENLRLERALLFAHPDKAVEVVGYAHPRAPKPAPGGVEIGTFGTLVALRRTAAGGLSSAVLGQQLGQQIVGMSPTQLGEEETAEEAAATAAEKAKAAEEEKAKKDAMAAAAEDEGEEGLETSGGTQLRMGESRLLRQDFLLHPAISVGHHLAQQNALVLDFARFKCGETKEEAK